MSADLKRRWLFHVHDENGDEFYIDGYGEGRNAEQFYVGTMAEAAREADRRATAWENLPGNGLCLQVTYESHGKIGSQGPGVGAKGKQVCNLALAMPVDVAIGQGARRR